MKSHNRGNRSNQHRDNGIKLNSSIKQIVFDRHYKYVENKDEFYKEEIEEVITLIERKLRKNKIMQTLKSFEIKDIEPFLTRDFLIEMLSEQMERSKPEDTTMTGHFAASIRMALIVKAIFPEYNIQDSEIGSDYKDSVKCTCGEKAEYVVEDGIGWYICPCCGAKVRTAPGTNIPMGSPADGKTRFLRVILHKKMETIYGNGYERAKLYKQLANHLGKTRKECHIGLMNEDELLEAFDFFGFSTCPDDENDTAISNAQSLTSTEEMVDRAIELFFEAAQAS